MTIVDHSRVAPSGLHMTIACAASLTLQAAQPPELDTEEILEGEAAHIIAAWAARGTLMPVGHEFTHKGRTWQVDLDMHLGAKIYAETCAVMTAKHSAVEQRVDIPDIHFDCWGTPDFWGAWYNGTTVALVRNVDYKYGHRYVDPFENWQGVGYLSGILRLLGIDTNNDNIPVEFVVVQPRAYHRDGPVQTWRTTPLRLNQYVMRARGHVAHALGEHGTPDATTGPQCVDCKARGSCATLRKSAARLVDFSGTADLERLDTQSAAIEARIIHDAIKRLEARKTGLMVQLDVEARAGKPVPYWALVPGRSNLAWLPDVSPVEVEGLAKLLGVPSVVKPPELVTPTQAIKLGIPESVIANYANRPPAGMTLKPDDSVKARKVFSHNAT